MIGLIFGILVILGTVIGGIYLVVQDYKGAGLGTLLGGSLFGVICILLGCITSVATGHTGIVTVFGKVEDTTLEAGFHMMAPWESVTEMDNRVQKRITELSCFSSDLQEVKCIYALNYQIDKEHAQEIYKNIGVDYYATVVEPSVQESVKTVVARYNAEELIGLRNELAKQIEDVLTTELSSSNIGVVSTAIEDLDFTDSFTNAVEAKQVAAQQKLKAEIEQAQAIKQAEADAAVAKTKAEADAAVAKTKATADAEIAQIQAQADMEVQKIGADAAAYAGQKEGSVAMQRLAAINGWTVVMNETTGINELHKPDNTIVTDAELLKGVEKLMEYYYTQSWDGKLPETYVGDDVSSILIGNK